MAEEKNPEQNVEPNDAERAQFEQDVLKAAQDAMNLEADGSTSSPTGSDNAGAGASQESAEKPADTEVPKAEAPKAEEKSAEPAAAPDPTEILKQQLAEANDRNLRLMAEFDNFRRRSAKESLNSSKLQMASSSKSFPKSRTISNAPSPAKTRRRISTPSKKACK